MNDHNFIINNNNLVYFCPKCKIEWDPDSIKDKDKCPICYKGEKANE